MRNRNSTLRRFFADRSTIPESLLERAEENIGGRVPEIESGDRINNVALHGLLLKYGTCSISSGHNTASSSLMIHSTWKSRRASSDDPREFQTIDWLLTQIERVLSVNDLNFV